jgi:predicted metalloprotease with PDZ domain
VIALSVDDTGLVDSGGFDGFRNLEVRVAFLLRLSLFALVAASFLAGEAAAQNISLRADLTDAPRGIIRGTLAIPVKPGRLTLVYPQWIPGYHGPIGPITDLSALKFTTAGKPVTWRRDLTDMYAFHLEIPQGAATLDISLEYLAPTGHSTHDPNTSSQLAVLEWNLIALMPQGGDASKIIVEPSLIVPAGWKFGCSMDQVAGAPADGAIHFKPTTLEMLIDQPVTAGRHFKQFDLSPGSMPPHLLDVAADSDGALAMNSDRLKAYQRVPLEYAALFGARHYKQYHFLLALSDRTGYNGLEHHQCSDNRANERALIDDDQFTVFASLLTHEYFHSWNGKHRRPADLLSPDFQKPMKDDLLWVYEGLTEYYGDVMAARAGLWKPNEYRENLALVAAGLATKQGRTWRPLQDTADMASKLYGSDQSWSMRRRSVDFYDEGELIWLDADTLIRQRTGGAKSLDDFCRAFHGEGSGGPALGGSKPTVAPYTADDVFATLASVVPNDWKGFFTARLTSLKPQPPMGGLTQGGWKLVYTTKPNKMLEAREKAKKTIDMRFSLGIVIDNEDDSHPIIDVVPNSPADKAGVGPNMKLLGVNGRKFDDDLLKDAVAATPTTKHIDLLLENATYFINAKLDYDGGARSPHLEKNDNAADLLKSVTSPRTKSLSGSGS